MQRGGFRAPGLSRMASGLALLLVALWAAPAISHAIFPLQQNPSGTRTNPYPAGTVQNLMVNVPEERGENPTSTVDVKVELSVVLLVANTAHPLDPRPDWHASTLEVVAWSGRPTASSLPTSPGRAPSSKHPTWCW